VQSDRIHVDHVDVSPFFPDFDDTAIGEPEQLRGCRANCLRMTYSSGSFLAPGVGRAPNGVSKKVGYDASQIMLQWAPPSDSPYDARPDA